MSESRRQYEQPTISVLSDLVELGFVHKETVSQSKSILGFDSPEKMELVDKYNLTEKGKSIVGESRGWGRYTSLCFGDYKVTEIVNFTPPSDFLGKTFSEVIHKYKIVNISKWFLESEALKSYLTSDTLPLDTTKEGKERVVLTNNGWIHPRLL